MKTIPLTQGLVTLIDDADYEAVSQFKWRPLRGRHCIYAITSLPRVNGKSKSLLLHRLLLPDSECVDHENGDGLNNQRYNLKASTNQKNTSAFNHKRLGTTSAYRGVSWYASKNKWQAQIQRKGIKKHIGYYLTEEEARQAYSAVAAAFLANEKKI